MVIDVPGAPGVPGESVPPLLTFTDASEAVPASVPPLTFHGCVALKVPVTVQKPLTTLKFVKP